MAWAGREGESKGVGGVAPVVLCQGGGVTACHGSLFLSLPCHSKPSPKRGGNGDGRGGAATEGGRSCLSLTLFSPADAGRKKRYPGFLRIGILPPCTPAPNLNPLRSKQGKEEGRGLDVGRGKGVSERGKGFLVPHFLPPPFVSRPSPPSPPDIPNHLSRSRFLPLILPLKRHPCSPPKPTNPFLSF